MKPIYKSIKVIDQEKTAALMRRSRTGADVTMRKMRELTGLSIGYICDLELGRRYWNEKLVELYSQALNK